MPPNKPRFDWVTYKAQLERIRVPDKVKCRICKKIRAQTAFSQRQLEELRKAMLSIGTTGIDGPGYASCLQCVGHQNFELNCCMCLKTKAVGDFSKSQRKDPDNARCYNCMQDQLETDPISHEVDQILADETTYATSNTRSHGAEITLDSMGRLSLNINNNRRGESTTSTNQAPTDIKEVRSSSNNGKKIVNQIAPGGGVFLGQENKSPGNSSTGSSRRFMVDAIPFTAYDAQGRPHARAATPPSVASTVHGGWADFGITRSNRQTPLADKPTRPNDGFAKTKGPRVHKDEMPSMRIPEPAGQTIESDDDDDSDGGFEKYV
ncbi:hypothetical protein AJ80_07836 [Polytolypa hystricis UAMH7299]|uniref:Stc1 domain-containing protein n=1 Tax=Polytolypa hystricis (strain UAMH7299) TaxID=1447883 RepID=A0A2B7XHB4_POLH7|nr:hypothetical protein AJ80_07836 [Polytolypa hystricis UAMH7299]